jgi:phosphohistidine swiveling domain-containing protein
VFQGEVLVVGSTAAAATDFASSSAAVFTAMEHLASASGIVAIESEIGGAAFASTSMVGSSVVA